MSSFRDRRRQAFLNEAEYKKTLQFIRDSLKALLDSKAQCVDQEALAGLYRWATKDLWEMWSLRFTAGEPLHVLAQDLEAVVVSYECSVDAYEDAPKAAYYDSIRLWDGELMDTYVNYVNLLSAAILLHREDLIPRIHGLIAGGEYDSSDLAIEELIKPYLPDRPEVDEWLWNEPYHLAMDAIIEDTATKREQGMRAYVKAWYPSMKGYSNFWNSHTRDHGDGMTYCMGYWTMEAAALSYLYNIDDSSYRDEFVYPKDLADYARTQPQRSPEAARLALQGEATPAPVAAGGTCPRSGWWSTPALHDERRYFLPGDTLPALDSEPSQGRTVWTWEPDQSPVAVIGGDSGQPAARAGLWWMRDDHEVRCRVQALQSLPAHEGKAVTWVWQEPVPFSTPTDTPCPTNGRWRCEDAPQVERTFAEGETLPPLDGRAVVWRLLQAI